MMTPTILSLAVVLLVAVVAPIVATVVKRVVAIPLVVFEIVLGILVGPAVLGWVQPNEILSSLAEFGLAMLFFMAGNEIDFSPLRGRPLTRAGLGWVISLAAGVVAGLIIAAGSEGGIYIGIALTSTALGTLMPILRDAGELTTPFGRAVTAVGAAGEFGPLLAISLFLSGRRPGIALLIFLAFALIAGLAIFAALQRPSVRLGTLVSASLRTSGQFAVRLVILTVIALVCLSLAFGLDMLLGAFAAGILSRALLRNVPEHDLEAVEAKLEAVSFGLLVPIFFVNTGVTFDLRALLDDSRALLLVPVFLVLLLVARGIPGSIAAPVGARFSERRSLVLFSATGLPIIVAVTGIALDEGALDAATAAALVGAGMLSVLLFPALALIGRGRVPNAENHAPENAPRHRGSAPG
jgi:Kef-type K+ transport system membrane component KefB